MRCFPYWAATDQVNWTTAAFDMQQAVSDSSRASPGTEAALMMLPAFLASFSGSNAPMTRRHCLNRPY